MCEPADLNACNFPYGTCTCLLGLEGPCYCNCDVGFSGDYCQDHEDKTGTM